MNTLKSDSKSGAAFPIVLSSALNSPLSWAYRCYSWGLRNAIHYHRDRAVNKVIDPINIT